MVTTKKQALTSRLLVPDHTSSVRKKGWCQTKRKPSLTCSTGETAAPSRGFGRRSVRSRLRVKQETAYDSASNRNGAHARTAYSRPPSGPPSSEAMCWRAWFWLYAVARSSSRTTAADRGDLCRLEDALGHAGEQRDDGEVGDGERTEPARDREAAVEDDAARAGHQHQRAAVVAVGEDARRQQHRAEAEQARRLEQGRDEGRAGQVVADEGEDEERHRRAELADGLPGPEDGEVTVASELPVAGHIPHHILRNNSCAIATCGIC